MTFSTIDLGAWMYRLLISWGLPVNFADKFDEIMMALVLTGLAIGVKFICQAFIETTLHKIADKSPLKWDSLLIQHKAIHYFLDTLPAFIVYSLLPWTFIKGKELLEISEKTCIVYIVFMTALSLNGFLLSFLDRYNQKEKNKEKPIKGLIQVFQVVVFFIAGIIIIAVIVGKSPSTLLAGLGASAAVLMLVFKDSLLGFVAGIQLNANNMVKPGDWITVPSANANGIVKEITLNTVKIQNFDNTISTVPPYNLVNGSFQNWRGMIDSAGRRVNKTIYIDMFTIKFCTPDMIVSFNKDIPLLADYKPSEGEVPTNSQVFRVYIEKYLRSLPIVNTDLDLIVSQQQMTTYGVPIQVYFFSRNKIWAQFETIQSDIFDHLIAMVPKFDLKIYQYTD